MRLFSGEDLKNRKQDEDEFVDDKKDDPIYCTEFNHKMNWYSYRLTFYADDERGYATNEWKSVTKEKIRKWREETGVNLQNRLNYKRNFKSKTPEWYNNQYYFENYEGGILSVFVGLYVGLVVILLFIYQPTLIMIP